MGWAAGHGAHPAHRRADLHGRHLVHFDQFNVENQVGFRGYSRMIRVMVGDRACSVSQLPGNENAALAADPHACKALVKADNRAAHTLRKRHRLWVAQLGLAVVAHDRFAILVPERGAMLLGGIKDDAVRSPVTGV